MKKIKFTKEFYKHLYDAIMDGAGDVEYDCDKDGYPDTFYVDGYAVDMTVYYGWEVHDDSFDHAFGTWHDPYPYMEAENLEDIDDVKVYDENTDEEVDGFDYDAFMAQFEVPTCQVYLHGKNRLVNVNSGDRVLYLGREATFLAKNNENGKLKVKTDRGVHYVQSKQVKFFVA